MLLCCIRALGVYYQFFEIHDIEKNDNKDLHQSATAAAPYKAKDAWGWRKWLTKASWRLKHIIIIMVLRKIWGNLFLKIHGIFHWRIITWKLHLLSLHLRISVLNQYLCVIFTVCFHTFFCKYWNRHRFPFICNLTTTRCLILHTAPLSILFVVLVYGFIVILDRSVSMCEYTHAHTCAQTCTGTQCKHDKSRHGQ